MDTNPNMWNRVQQRLGASASKRLSNSTVDIIGFGSLGSWIGLMLAMAGVGHFTLADPDNLEDHNTVRHAADLRYVGRPKIDIGRELITWRNPNATVELFADDARNHPEAFTNADLVIIAGLGSERSQAQMARILRNLGKPVLVGGLYEKAVAGEVFFVNPYEGPCYACFASQLRETTVTEDLQPVEYGLPLDEVKAQPGLGIHVMRVATVAADWTIRQLIDDPTVLKPYPGNLAIISNEEDTIGQDSSGTLIVLPPASSRWMTIPKLDGCHVCGLAAPSEVQSISQLNED